MSQQPLLITVDGDGYPLSDFRNDEGLQFAIGNHFRGRLCSSGGGCRRAGCTYLHPVNPVGGSAGRVGHEAEPSRGGGGRGRGRGEGGHGRGGRAGGGRLIFVDGQGFPDSDFYNDPGREFALTHGGRGHLCKRQRGCKNANCTYLHRVDAPHGGGTRAPPPTVSTEQDAQSRELIDVLSALDEDDAIDQIDRLGNVAFSTVVSTLRIDNQEATTIKVIARMLRHASRSWKGTSPQNTQETVQFLHASLKWFKGLRELAMSKSFNHRHLEDVLSILVQHAAELDRFLVEAANKLREAIPAASRQHDIWKRFDDRVRRETLRPDGNLGMRARHRSRNEGPSEYAATTLQHAGPNDLHVLCDETDFSDMRDKNTILHHLHGIVVNDPVPKEHSRRHLLEQFRTYREDYVAAMRAAVKTVRSIIPINTALLKNGGLPLQLYRQLKERDTEGDVRLYTAVRCAGVAPYRGSLVFRLSIDMEQFSGRTVNWDKRLMQGNLLLLSARWFDASSPIFAGTVVRLEDFSSRLSNNNNNQQRRGGFDGTFGLELNAPVEFLRYLGVANVFSVLESTSFFLPYQRVLSVLKEVLDHDRSLSLGAELMEGRTQRTPPYLTRCRHLSLTKSIALLPRIAPVGARPPGFCGVLGAGDGSGGVADDVVDVLSPDGWSRCAEWSSKLEEQLSQESKTLHCVDTTQREALQHIFTHSVAVVQGTPGTGKTFLGAKFVQIVLDNYRALNCGPIVCICLTNHAIDAFLEQILLFEKPEKIVRLGGMSKNPEIAELALSKKAKIFTRHRDQESLLQEFHQKITALNQFLLEESLSEERESELFTVLRSQNDLHSWVQPLVHFLGSTNAILDQRRRGAERSLKQNTTELHNAHKLRDDLLVARRLPKNLTSLPQVDDYIVRRAELAASCKNSLETLTRKCAAAAQHLSLVLDATADPKGCAGRLLTSLELQSNEDRCSLTQAQHAHAQRRATQENKEQSNKKRNKKQKKKIDAAGKQQTKGIPANTVGDDSGTHPERESSTTRAGNAHQQFVEEQTQLEQDMIHLQRAIDATNVCREELVKASRDFAKLEAALANLPFLGPDVRQSLQSVFHSIAALHHQCSGDEALLEDLTRQRAVPALERWRTCAGATPGVAAARAAPGVAATAPDATNDDAERQAVAGRLQRGQAEAHRFLDVDSDDDGADDIAFDNEFTLVSLRAESGAVQQLCSAPFDHLEPKIRQALYDKLRWLYRCIRYLELHDIVDKIAAKRQEFQNIEDQQRAAVLAKHTVVGATTAGASAHLSTLRKLKPKIVIVEEAAEVLESHILACLADSVEHLILIGDHKQLQPKVEQELVLGRHKHLSVSLMERLVRIDAPYVTLTTQRRMHPDISRFTTDYYLHPTHLKDKAVTVINHPSTLRRRLPTGIDGNRRVFFVTHNGDGADQKEHDLPGLQSKYNMYEAELALAICQWMSRCNPEMTVTLLAPYSGQVVTLIKLALQHKIEYKSKVHPNGINIISIDDYQGEESDIVVLTLVRTESLGFLKLPNRACVALSRAKCGMYVVGCTRLLISSDNDNVVLKHFMRLIKGRIPDHRAEGGITSLWNKLLGSFAVPSLAAAAPPLDDAESELVLYGTEFPAVCPVHPNVPMPFRRLRDAPQCNELCAMKLPNCHHRCSLVCHGGSEKHGTCTNLCARIGVACTPPRAECRHPCPKKCSEPCGKCTVPVPHTCQDCDHETLIPCHHHISGKYLCHELVVGPCKINPTHVVRAPCCEWASGAAYKHCTSGCNQKMTCGHTCTLECHDEDEDHSIAVRACTQSRRVMHPKCGRHQIDVPCREYPDGKIPRCTKICGLVAPCGHPCERKCGECDGAHKCTSRTAPLTLQCGHAHQVKCRDRDTFVCPTKCEFMLECEHSCPGTCGECRGSKNWFDHRPCQGKCPKSLVCGHRCQGSCSTSCRPCKAPCEFFCGHGTGCAAVSEKNRHACSDCPNRECQDPCGWDCPHQKCSRSCFEDCDRPPCYAQCTKRGRGGSCTHGAEPCLGVCGELCPDFCRTCFREFRSRDEVYLPRRNVFTLDVHVMEEEMDSFLLGELVDPEFLNLNPSLTRLVQLPCCGVIMLSGDLDQHIQAVCGESEVVAPKCLRCHSVIQPGYYRQLGNALKKRHREIQEVSNRIRGLAEDVQEDIEAIQAAAAALVLRCVFGPVGTSSKEGRGAQEVAWKDLLDACVEFEHGLEPLLRKLPQSAKDAEKKRVRADYETRHAAWQQREDAHRAVQDRLRNELPLAVVNGSNTPNEDVVVKVRQQAAATAIRVFITSLDVKENPDESVTKALQHRLQAAEVLVHFCELRKAHLRVSPSLAVHNFFTNAHKQILCKPGPSSHDVLMANLNAFAFRLDVLRREADEVDQMTSAANTPKGTPQHVAKSSRFADWEQFVAALLHRAEAVVRNQQLFARGVGRGRFVPNPCLARECSAFQRFTASLVDRRATNLADRCRIAFHGTATEAIGAICCRGFDVTRRRGQAHGPGEYFGATPEVSAGYARGSERMLICALLTDHISESGQILVVNNPVHDVGTAYVMPLGVVVYGAAAQQLADDRSLFSCSFPSIRSGAINKVKSYIDTLQQDSRSLVDSEEAQKHIVEKLDEHIRAIEKALGLTRPSREILQSLSRALGVTAGHWYKCSKGHLYVIGDCGGAMTTSTCPTCGEIIGGASHRLVDSNQSAANDVLQGAVAAWPQ